MSESTTAVNGAEIGPLCPFRKDVFTETDSNGIILAQYDDFLPCYGEKCAMWVFIKETPGHCGLLRG